jgi:Zn-dependent protease with chaperone function
MELYLHSLQIFIAWRLIIGTKLSFICPLFTLMPFSRVLYSEVWVSMTSIYYTLFISGRRKLSRYMQGRHARACPCSLCCAWLRSSVAALSQRAFDGPQPLRAVTHTPDPINLQAAYVLGAHSIHSLDYQPAFTMLRAQWRQKWRKVCVWHSFFFSLLFHFHAEVIVFGVHPIYILSRATTHVLLKGKYMWD